MIDAYHNRLMNERSYKNLNPLRYVYKIKVEKSHWCVDFSNFHLQLLPHTFTSCFIMCPPTPALRLCISFSCTPVLYYRRVKATAKLVSKKTILIHHCQSPTEGWPITRGRLSTKLQLLHRVVTEVGVIISSVSTGSLCSFSHL